jgi:hypothetical protein
MKSKTILVVLLTLLVVLAGCTGGGGGPSAGDGNDGGADGQNGDGNGNGDGDGGDGGDGNAGSGQTWRAFEFEKTGKYTFDVFVEGDGSGTLVWDVQRVSGDEVTAHISYDVGDTSYESTVTGTTDIARQQLLGTPAGALLVTTMFTPGLWYGGRELAVGNGWSYQTGEGSGSFQVTERRNLGGMSCYATEMKIDGTLRHEGCFSPDHGLAPYSAWYDEEGKLQMEVKLRNYGPTEGPSSDVGDGDGDGASDEGTAEPTPEPGDDEPADDPGQFRWNALEFDRPATYTYEVFLEDEGEGTLVWDVRDVSGDRVTVHLDYDVGETQYQSTVTGTKESVRQQTMMTPAGALLMLTVYTPMAWYQGQDLTVGNEWTYAGQEGTMRFAVTGQDTYAGVQCFATEVTIDGETRHEACVSPDLGLTPYSAWYDEDGDLVMELRLVKYESG